MTSFRKQQVGIRTSRYYRDREVSNWPVRILLQVGAHLAERGELHDDPDGRRAAHAHQTDDVRVRELLHYVCNKSVIKLSFNNN